MDIMDVQGCSGFLRMSCVIFGILMQTFYGGIFRVDVSFWCHCGCVVADALLL